MKTTTERMISSAVSRGSTGSNSPVSDAVAQDQLGHIVHDLLVRPDGIPAGLDRGHHQLVDALLGGEVFLMIRQDLEDQPLHALRRRGLGAGDRPGLLLDARTRQSWQIASTIAFLEGKKR